jgi:hypothetical protein
MQAVMPSSARNIVNTYKTQEYEKKYDGKLYIVIDEMPITSESLLRSINIIFDKKYVFCSSKYHKRWMNIIFKEWLINSASLTFENK